MAVAASTRGEASAISSASAPASGQPVILRVTSPQVPIVVMPTPYRVRMISGRLSTCTQWSWMFCRTVMSATPRA